MTQCRGCGARIPPRLKWPRHCGPACRDLAVERAISAAMGSDKEHEARAARVCARDGCGARLLTNQKRCCSHACREALRRDMQERTA